jgi:sarcosine oxidase, subunit gamma
MPDLIEATQNGLHAAWLDGQSVINLRGDPDDAAFRDGMATALGLDLPTLACTRSARGGLQIVWAGPDDWFVITSSEAPDVVASRLRSGLANQHVAVTDVSSGYTVLQLRGEPVRDVLAEGCPLDLHPRVFKTGQSAGSHFFKASVWLWQTDDAPVFEMLVRRSFGAYVQLMLEKATQECGLNVAACDEART